MAIYNGKHYDPDTLCQDDHEWLTERGAYARYNDPDSDISEKPVSLQIKYACGHVEPCSLIQEDLANLWRNSDGTYSYSSIVAECAQCLLRKAQD